MSDNKDAETVGRTFGRLTAVSAVGSNQIGRRVYRCTCSCGGTSVVDGGSLRNGNTQSCGCVATEKAVKRSTTHGFGSRSNRRPEYGAWNMTKQRCVNPKQRDFRRYGARGITICARWLDFENFLADMGPRPPGLTLERLDNARGYEPGNCEWASRKSQTRNREMTVTISCWGETRALAEWSEITGIQQSTLRARVGRLGYTSEVALTKKVKPGATPC